MRGQLGNAQRAALVAIQADNTDTCLVLSDRDVLR